MTFVKENDHVTLTLNSKAGLMKYCSTRGGVHGLDFRDVLFSGFAADGGMFMPERLPVLSPDTLRGWMGLSYTKVVEEVASLFIPTQLIPREDLEGELRKYSLLKHLKCMSCTQN